MSVLVKFGSHLMHHLAGGMFEGAKASIKACENAGIESNAVKIPAAVAGTLGGVLYGGSRAISPITIAKSASMSVEEHKKRLDELSSKMDRFGEGE